MSSKSHNIRRVHFSAIAHFMMRILEKKQKLFLQLEILLLVFSEVQNFDFPV
jgi:hypothetical protein